MVGYDGGLHFRIFQQGGNIFFDTHPSSPRIFSHWSISSGDIRGRIVTDLNIMEVSNGLSFTDGVEKSGTVSGWIESTDLSYFTSISNYNICAGGGFWDGLMETMLQLVGNQKIFSFEYYNTDNYVTIENPGGTGNFPSFANRETTTYDVTSQTSVTKTSHTGTQTNIVPQKCSVRLGGICIYTTVAIFHARHSNRNDHST